MQLYPDFFIKLEGDPNIAGSYVGYAKSVARQVYDQAQRQGGYASKMLATDDSLIKISVSPQSRTIYIQSVAESPVEVISGMTDFSFVVEVNEKGKSSRKLKRFYPTQLQADADNTSRDWKLEKRLVSNTDPNNIVFSDTERIQFGQTANVAPAKYTGKMCKVVQVAMGIPNNTIHYQWGFDCTHGIYTAGDGTLWLIEISKLNGVIAKKLTGHKKAKNKELDALIKKHLPIIPDGKAFVDISKSVDINKSIMDLISGGGTNSVETIEKMIAKGKVRRLMTYEKLSDFYSKMPFYQDCGWAFNTDGSSAVNTCWDWPDDYKRGYLYQIDISGDEKGPKNAELKLVEKGYIYNPDHSSDLPRSRLSFPNGSGYEVETFECRNAGYPKGPPSNSSWETPVHAFYVGDELKVYRQSFRKNETKSITDGWTPFDPLSLPRRQNVFGADFPLDDSVFDLNFVYTSGLTIADVFDFTGPGIPEARLIGADSMETFVYRKEPETGPGEGFRTENGDILLFHQGSYWTEGESKNGVSEMKMNALVISPMNRSCVFIFTQEHIGNSYYERSMQWGGRALLNGSSGERYHLTEKTYTTADGNSTAYYEWESDGGTAFNGNGGVFIGGGPDDNPLTNDGPMCMEVRWEIDGETIVGSCYPASEFILEGTPVYGRGGEIEYMPDPVDRTFSVKSYKEMMESSNVKKDSGESIKKYTLTTQNYDKKTTVDISDDNEIAIFLLAYHPSPDEYGDYIEFNSGYSAFKKSSFSSKNTNGLHGEDLNTSPADGEDMKNLSSIISWVGFE